MSTARAEILAGIRKALRRGPLAAAEQAALEDRIRRHDRHIIPERVNRSTGELVELFLAKAGEVATTLEEVDDSAGVAGAIAGYLARENLPARLVAAPAVREFGVDWDTVPTLEVRTGSANRDDGVAVTVGMAGIAETGTLLLVSGADTPTSLNFVPPHGIVLLRRGDIVGSWEDGWDLVRRSPLPRVVNFVTGPSRTGDIEQKIQIGVHGPVRLHVILVG